MFYFPKLINQYINTYMGNVEHQGNAGWGDYFYITCDKDVPAHVISTLEGHTQLLTKTVNDDSYWFVYEFTPHQKDKIVKPFLEGAYSKIDREYVAKQFPRYNSSGNMSINYRILVKDEVDLPVDTEPLANYWYRRIGIRIPVGAEV